MFDSDSIVKLGFLPRSLAIVGAGIVAIEFARIFQLLGARVTLLARTESKLQATVKELRDAEAARRGAAGGEASVQYVCADQTSWAQLTSAVAKAADAYGPPDALVACAGGALPGL